ncbi:hypothetical protein RJ639_001141 [Escallonia herrerae]|uniref:Chalcone/stilbene synthase N-terminal domain-containing protein n=1 Tax=Escallonia herrerae TaxID=1293975 RepID=A0AA89BIY8_9ASTE|nr:hypothetical protein RJ639_001141 [Escallonia herrerae]
MTCRKVLQFGWGNISGQFPAVVNDLPSYMALSLDARQDMVVIKIPKLSKEASAKAIKKWGQPKSNQPSHLVFCTSSSVKMPDTDYQLTKLLGLHPSVNRVASPAAPSSAWPRISLRTTPVLDSSSSTSKSPPSLFVDPLTPNWTPSLGRLFSVMELSP